MTRALAFFLLLLAASPCAAQDQSAAARASFDEAARQFDAQNYALALQGFMRAYEQLRAINHPRAAYTLYNVGRCYEELAQLSEARAAFERYLSESDQNAPNRAEVSDRIRDISARIELAGGGEDETAPTTPAAGGGESLSWIGWGLVGLGGAAVLVSLITGGVAIDQGNQLAARCPDFTCGPSDAGLIDSADAFAIATDVLLFSGLTIAALGVVLALVLDTGSAPAASAMCTGDGCMLSFAHAF